MSGIEVIATEKVIGEAAKKSEGFLKALFKESISEWGGMIADNVRLRRFNNQIKIFQKAQEKLKEKRIDPKKVSLKVLAPLLEFTSLEEEPTIQDMWSNLTVDILERDEDSMFHQNAIAILNKLSAQEAKLLHFMYNKFAAEVSDLIHETMTISEFIVDYSGSKAFQISQMEAELNESRTTLQYRISNLIGLNLFSWKTSVVIEERVSERRPTNSYIASLWDFTNIPQAEGMGLQLGMSRQESRNTVKQNVKVDDEAYLVFTPFGLKLMMICTK